jgi:hypothetical protein
MAAAAVARRKNALGAEKKINNKMNETILKNKKIH